MHRQSHASRMPACPSREETPQILRVGWDGRAPTALARYIGSWCRGFPDSALIEGPHHGFARRAWRVPLLITDGRTEYWPHM